ncbi:DEAD/DEAH box helicase [Rhizobiaceae bacterium]|nr:DEAD/DEAH box helicase [Rhizobiaceae bacterium]
MIHDTIDLSAPLRTPVPDRHDDPDYAFLFADAELRKGDAVIHFENGLACFDGRETVEADGEEIDMIRLAYRKGGQLLLPASELEHVWRYGADASDVTLDRLKGSDWASRRDGLVRELTKVAQRLGREFHRRQAEKARKLVPDPGRYEAFAKGFPHELTSDQSRAIDATLSDLRGEHPMDRLVVGDVGFGKTEVAMHAIAAAVFSGAQAVMVAPTTVLARQHANALRARFEPLGVRVEEVSRLRTAQENAAARTALAEGNCDIVVGTHAVMSGSLDKGRADIPGLGLVVVDEEHKFGARRKRALRRMGRVAHILSMTATPIPRSLAMAEVGLCSVSVVASAPRQRLPVETRVMKTSLDAAVAAVRREHEREGQAYVVAPRVRSLKKLRPTLEKALGDITMQTAHGKLDRSEIETSMLAFMQGDCDVLLATSIIESGLDNGRANTMVVFDAERFGLAQLHQLRGRIGRSKLPAQMVLMSDIDLTEESPAQRRLLAFAQMAELGAGFRVSAHDRSARGYGALSGTEQSGKLTKLGIELYRRLLVRELRRTEGGDTR